MNTGRAVILKGVADVLARLAGLITFPILARYADVDGYGAFTQMNTIVGFLIPFASLGLGSAMVRFFVAPDWTEGVRRGAIRTGAIVLGAGLLISGVIAASAPLLNELFLRWPGGDELFRWGSLLIAIGAFEFWLLDLMRARTWWTSFSVFQIAQTALGVAAVVVLLPQGYSLVDLVIATVILRGLGTTVTALIVVVRAPAGPPGTGTAEVPGVGRMLRFGFPLTVAGLGLWMVNLSDRLVIGYFLDPDALGLYGATYTMASLLLVVTAALFLPAYPRLMQAVADADSPRLASEVRLFHRFVALAAVPGAVFLAIVIHPALLVLGGSAFDVDVAIGALIVAGLFLNQWNGIAHYVLACFDRTVFVQNAWLGCGALNVALNIVAVPAWGIIGAAAVTLLSFVVLEIVVFAAAGNYVDLTRNYRFATTLRATVASVAAGAVAIVLIAIASSEAIGVVAATGGFWLTYVAAVALMRELRGGDLRMVLRAVGLPSGRSA